MGIGKGALSRAHSIPKRAVLEKRHTAIDTLMLFLHDAQWKGGPMPSPKELVLIRHGTSTRNHASREWQKNELYQEFIARYRKEAHARETQELAQQLREIMTFSGLRLEMRDADIILTIDARTQVATMARKLETKTPDIIFTSNYVRAKQTLVIMQESRADLKTTDQKNDEAIRDREFGSLCLYGDVRIFLSLNPDEKRRYDLEKHYTYRFPGGENIPDVRQRVRMWLTMLQTAYAGKRVLAVAHMDPILAIRCELEHMGEDDFSRLSIENPPANASVTLYRNNHNNGRSGTLQLVAYNQTYT